MLFSDCKNNHVFKKVKRFSVDILETGGFKNNDFVGKKH